MDIEEATSILEIVDEITNDSVDAAYKKLASTAHPDKGGDSEKMARLNQARAFLHEHISRNNLPAVIKQFEIAVKEMNAVAREQRALEKRVEKTEKEISASATSRLKSYKNMALILVALSAAAIFLGKDIPKELISSFAPEAGEIPITVSKPIENKLVKETNLKIDNSKDNKENLKLTEEEIKAVEKYKAELRKYREYEYSMAMYKARKDEAKKFTLMWYLVTFGVGIYAGLGAWFLNRKIRRVEEELDELLEDLSFKSRYANLLLDLFEGDIKSSWTFKDLLVAIASNSHFNDRLAPLVREVGKRKIAQLLINKGLESSAITVSHGNIENKYEETYSLS